MLRCRNTPGLLFTAAFALYALAPAAVYLLPDTSNGFIAAQVNLFARPLLFTTPVSQKFIIIASHARVFLSSKI